MHRRIFLLGGLAAAAVTGCSSVMGKPEVHLYVGTTTYEPVGPDIPEAVSAAKSSQLLAWRVLTEAPGPENRLCSPASMAAALALVGLGATGKTAQDFDELFGMTATDRARSIDALRNNLRNYESLPKTLDAKKPPKTPVVHIANRILMCGDAEPKQPFLDEAKTYLDAGAERARVSEAQDALDSWVKDNTAGLIEKSGVKVTDSTLLVVQDALLFAAAWSSEFTSDKAPLSFTRGDGEQVEISALKGDFHTRSASGDGWKAVRLSYDDTLAMDVLLPPQGISPLSWDVSVLQETHEALTAAPLGTIEVVMPSVDLRHTLDLKTLLEALGINLSSFNNIFDGAEVEQAVQQTRLQVTAQGTVGAAVTEISIPMSAPVPGPGLTELIVDHPYLMRVLDVRTGWPLFLAVVSDPLSE